MKLLYKVRVIVLIILGGEALVSCGLMESLLKVIEWPGEEDCITVRYFKLFSRGLDLSCEVFNSSCNFFSLSHEP